MDAQLLEGGFTNAPVDAAHAFRAAMNAMARPGRIEAIAGGQGPAPISAAAATLRRLFVAAIGLFAGGIRHGVAFVESDNPVEPFAQPGRHLVEPRRLPFAFGGTQSRVSDKEDAFGLNRPGFTGEFEVQ